jgi:hypothetical protein
MDLPLVGKAYKELSLNLDAQTCINFYLHGDPSGKFPLALYPRPGLTLHAEESGAKSCRAMYSINDSAYVIIDNKLYSLNSNALLVPRGTLETFEGRCSIIDNGFQLLITDQQFGYVYQYQGGPLDPTPTSIFTKVTDSDFIAPVILAYQDGYGIYASHHSIKVHLTHLFDFDDIDALSFQSASGLPDWVVSIISSHQELWIFCQLTAEVWYNTGATTTVFERRQTLLIEHGCAAPYSVVKADNGILFWLAQNKGGNFYVVQTQGYIPKIISDPPLELAISQYERIDDAFAFSFQMHGHIFYVLTFPTADKTWIYDIGMDAWYEWKSTLPTVLPAKSDTVQGRWLPNCYMEFNGKHLVGDFSSGKIYEIDINNFTDNSVMIRRERTSRHIQQDLKRITVNEIQISFEEGVGQLTGQGINPQVMYQYSKDNAHSWSKELWRSVGKTGETNWRALWSRLGKSRDWVHSIVMTDPVKWIVLGATMDAEIEK